MSVGKFVLSIFGAIGSFLIFFITGAVLLTVGVVKNRRRNRPAGTFPMQPPPGAPGNYPPPPNTTFPAPPPYNPGPNPDRPHDRPQDR
jgi:hypothetical protein